MHYFYYWNVKDSLQKESMNEKKYKIQKRKQESDKTRKEFYKYIQTHWQNADESKNTNNYTSTGNHNW